MDQITLQWIGYVASVVIAVSMTMNSIVKFRIINLVGASLFFIYGIVISAIPVILLNAFIVIVDIYYLRKIFSKKETFETIQVRSENKYLLRFLEFHKEDIKKFFPGFDHQPEQTTHSFFVLRNMAVAGLFLGQRENENILRVHLDYVTSAYRDFKNGKFIFHRLRRAMLDDGFTKVITQGHTKRHQKYLMKLGFKEVKGKQYELRINPDYLPDN